MSLFNIQSVQADSSLGAVEAKPVIEAAAQRAEAPAAEAAPLNEAAQPADNTTNQPAAESQANEPAQTPGQPAATQQPAATASASEPNQAADTPAPQEGQAEWEKKMMAKFGVSSMEELENKVKASAPAETDAQRIEREGRYNADLNHFAVTSKYLTQEELVSHQTVQGRKAEDIVFDQYAAAYKASNPDGTDDEARVEFRQTYHLDSDNAFLKAQGEEAINTMAEKAKAPGQQKYDAAKALFDARRELEQKRPQFESAIKTTVEKAIPARLELVKGDGPDTTIGFDVTPAERAEIEKALLNDDDFRRYLSFKEPQQAAEYLNAHAANVLWLRNKEAIISTVREAAFNMGTKSGSNTGAEQPFTVKKTAEAVPVTSDVITDADLAQTRRHFRS